MFSSKISITIGYQQRTQISPGVYEDVINEYDVKAQQLVIRQNRLDQAFLDDIPITNRFSIREDKIYQDTKMIKYVWYKGNKYKVNLIYNNPQNHFIEIETGELM